MSQPVFVFDNYQLTDKKLDFRYHYKDSDGHELGHFTESYTLPEAIGTSDPTINYILKMYHLLAGISYYKSLLGTVELPYSLNASEAAYLNDIYDNGLGEYSYVNKLTDPIRPFAANTDALDQT